MPVNKDGDSTQNNHFNVAWSDKCSDSKKERKECELQNSIVTAKLKYEMDLIHHDRTTIYKYLRSMSKDSDVPTILFHNESPIYDQQDIAKLFNDYFNSVFTKNTCDLHNHNNLPVPSSQLSQIFLAKHLVVVLLVPKFRKYVPQFGFSKNSFCVMNILDIY